MNSLLDEGMEGFSSKNSKIPPNRKEKIEAELKLLEWHKLANSAAIKAALLQNKSVKSPPKKPQHREDDSRWIRKVITQEHIKPLEVSKDYVLDYEKNELQNAERLTSQVNRHITTLKTLRVKLEARQDLKERTDEYRSWQKGFLPKKHAVLNGKTLDDLDASGMMIGNNGNNTKGSKNNTLNRSRNLDNEEDERDKEIDDLKMAKAREKALQKQGQGSNQELSTVLDSLSRLAELEHRISSLEKENQYDSMLNMERTPANQRTAIEFIKKRAQADDHGPVGLKYEVRNKKDWKVQMPNGVGAGSAAVRAKQRGFNQQEDYVTDDDFGGSQEGDGGPGIFITADDTGGGAGNAAAKREALRKERQRQIALASQGQKQLRTRVQLKKGRQMEKMTGAKKHEEAMREMARRKTEAGARKVGAARAGNGAGGARPIQLPNKGLASGMKTKNKHLQDFEALKQGHRKRTEDVQRGLQKQAPRPPVGGIENRYISQTAPAYNNSNHPQYRNGRAPTTKVGGTVTRRTDNPTRRPAAGGNDSLYATAGKAPLTAPPMIAVTGMGGLRVLKASNNNAGKSVGRR